MSDAVGNGISIGGLTLTEDVSSEDLLAITQGYTTQGTGQTRKTKVKDLVQAGVSDRTVAVSISGKPGDGANFQVMFCQAGTLSSTGAVASVITNPGATNTLTLETINGGSPTSHGSISIATSGAVTFPTFSQAMAIGDSLRITNQNPADGTGADYAFGFPFVG